MTTLSGKKILVISSVYPLSADGNHGAFVREAILRLKPLGINFCVFAPSYEGSKSYILDGVKVRRFRYFIKKFENLVRDGAPTKLQKQPIYLVVAAFYITLGMLQLFWTCLVEKPDLLHVNWPFPHGLMALPVSKLLGVPMVFSYHGGELLLANKYKFVSSVLKALTKQASGVTANSSFTKRLISKVYDGPVDVIPYGLTINAKAPNSRDESSSFKILFVGRLDERKGLKYLLEALPAVLERHDVTLRIVGKGILEEEIYNQCHAMRLDSIVKFLGFVSKEKLANEYASCDVFVLPAIVDSKGDTEGLGIVMIEALAHEKPVIASAVGGIVDVIQPEVTGILVPEKDPIALSNAIVRVLENPEWASELGRRGLKDIQTRFSWSRISGLWQSIFEIAVSGKESSVPSLRSSQV
jgi:glycosyltransferase involved in cell wall biosynthesis